MEHGVRSLSRMQQRAHDLGFFDTPVVKFKPMAQFLLISSVSFLGVI